MIPITSTSRRSLLVGTALSSLALIIFAGPAAKLSFAAADQTPIRTQRAATDVQEDALYNVFSRIENDYAAGILSYGESQVLKVRAIRNSSSLPQEYRSAKVNGSVASQLVSRCATAALLEARRALDSLSPALQTELQGLLARPLRAATFDSPGGHFKLHYDTSGSTAVPLADDDASGAPDFIERVALYADSSWRTEVELFGYLPPPSDGSEGGDSRYDIYFDDLPFFGLTQAELVGPAAWNDATSYIVCHNDFIGLTTNSDPEGSAIGAAKVTIAHEFQHAVQFAYDFDDEVWFMESSATWMEEMVFDDVNDNYNYFPHFHSEPQTALTKNLAPHFYATFIWPLYLSQRYDTSLIRRAWEGARFKNVMESLADSLPALQGVSRDSAFSEFIVWACLTGNRNDGQRFEEASAYPEMSIADTVTSLPVFSRQVRLKPQGYGSALVRFSPTGASGTLQVSFQGNVNRNWEATVIATRGAADHDIFTIQLNSSGFGSLRIPAHEQYSEITLIGMNLTAYSVSAEYSFSAEMVSGAAVTGTAVSDTIAYTLRDNHVGYRFTNLGAGADSFRVFAHESSGWGVGLTDSAHIALAAGADTTVIASVVPPAGTLPGAQTTVTIGVVSLSDTTIADSVTVNQTVEIYRGDPNWDGKVNMADIIYLISRIFSGGPPPVPGEMAADANCDNSFSIVDVVYLVTVLLQENALPVCNQIDPL